MTTTAKIGHGTRLQRTPTDSPGTVNDLGELIEIGGPELSRDAVDASHMLSPDQYREFISGMRDAGEVSFTVALVPDNTQGSVHQELIDDYNTNSTVRYRLLFPDANTYWEFDALLTSIPHAIPLDDRMTIGGTMKISGRPELARLA